MKKYVFLWLMIYTVIFSDSRVLYKGKEDKNDKVVALTFDDGPNSTSFYKVYEILKNENIKASFFLIGKYIEEQEKYVKTMYENGYEILNHSYNHVRLDKLAEEELKNELLQTEEKIEKITGKQIKIYRAPFGIFDKKQVDTALELKMIPVMWNVDARDWDSKLTVEEIVNNLKKDIAPNSIIVMHTQKDNYKSFEVLKVIIPYLKKEGYKFETVSEIIKNQ